MMGLQPHQQQDAINAAVALQQAILNNHGPSGIAYAAENLSRALGSYAPVSNMEPWVVALFVQSLIIQRLLAQPSGT